MARINLSDPDDIDGPHAEAVQASEQRWGFVANIERAFAMWPELAMAEQDLTDAVMVDGELSAALKEAVGVVVSLLRRGEPPLGPDRSRHSVNRPRIASFRA